MKGSLRRRASLTFLGAAFLAVSLDAHELATTQVELTIQSDDSYQVDVAVDPDALLTRLALMADGVVDAQRSRAQRDSSIARLAPVFLTAVVLTFDGGRQIPAFSYRAPSAQDDAAQRPGVVRLTGRVPRGAQTMSFRYDLAGGTFALVARVRGQPAQIHWIGSARASDPIRLAPESLPTTGEVAWQYLRLGFEHILPKGLDHILFVVSLLLLSPRWRRVVAQTSTFTIAHSLTLALTMYNVIALPPPVVEPLIALSIVYVACENLLTSELKSWRIALVFSFGLLHGMGFAGVLRELGLPRQDFLTALVTFNLGVETGQLVVVGVGLAAIWFWRSDALAYRRYIVKPASLLIAVTGLYWTVERLLS